MSKAWKHLLKYNMFWIRCNLRMVGCRKTVTIFFTKQLRFKGFQGVFSEGFRVFQRCFGGSQMSQRRRRVLQRISRGFRFFFRNIPEGFRGFQGNSGALRELRAFSASYQRICEDFRRFSDVSVRFKWFLESFQGHVMATQGVSGI